jgi:hypothetical protein
MVPTDGRWDLILANGKRVDLLTADAFQAVERLAKGDATMLRSVTGACRQFHSISVAMDDITREDYRMTTRQDFDKYCSLHHDSIRSYHMLSFLAYHAVAVICDSVAWSDDMARNRGKQQLLWSHTLDWMLVAIKNNFKTSRNLSEMHKQDRFLRSQLHHHILDKYRRLVSMREEVAEQPLKHMLGNDVFHVVVAYL